MHLTARRFSTSLVVGVALVGLGAAPALAGAPTPSSLKMAPLAWEKLGEPGDPSLCFFAISCANSYWGAAGDDAATSGFLYINSGHIKGKKAAKAKVAEASDAYLSGLSTTIKTKKYTYKYKAKGKQHKTKIELVRTDDGTNYGQLILSYDLVKKKNGKLVKRVPVGIMAGAQGVPGVSDKLRKKKGKLLKKQVRKLTKVAAKTPMVGPVNPEIFGSD